MSEMKISFFAEAQNLIKNEIVKLPSNWHRRDVFYKLSLCISKDKKINQLIDEFVFSEQTSARAIKEKYGEKYDVACVILNDNLGDRFNFSLLSIAVAAKYYGENAKVALILQNDSTSDLIISCLRSDFLKIDFFKEKLDPNDAFLALSPLNSGVFALNWWSYEVQRNYLVSEVSKSVFLDWGDYINNYKRNSGKWDILTRMYSIPRHFLSKVMRVEYRSTTTAGDVYRKKRVLISPSANTLGGENKNKVEMIFEKLIDFLNESDVDYFENVRPGDNPKIKGAKIAEIKSEDILNKSSDYDLFIGLRSGLCDVLAFAKIPMHVIYPSEPRGVETLFAGWLPFSRENQIKEHILGVHSVDDILGLLKQDLKIA